ncbi:snRNA-activating protein complex subunit 4 [Rhinophrynus dorsalis]
MTAIDINAEREKIQREIEALERSLGTSVAAIEVSLSDSNLDSDDDDFDIEDNLEDEDLEDEEDWEDGDNKAEMCLQMNLVYQAVIEEKIQEVELLIAQNKEQQEELLWDISGLKLPKAGEAKLYPLNLAIGHFMKPYFKDKVTGVGPPANQDMIDKAAQGIKPFGELANKQWRNKDQTELRQAVISDRLQKLLQPKLLKLEYLQQKLDDAQEDIDKKVLAKQIQEAESEIDDINQLSEEALLGKRTDEHDWDKISNINFEGVHSAQKLKMIWQNSEHPSINKEDWTEDEVLKMRQIAEKHSCVNWEAIAGELGTNRTAFQCLQKYQLTSKGFKRKEFTKEEDEMLTHFVQQMRVGNHIPYQKIAYFMEGRDAMQLLFRWSKSLDPKIKKGPWTPEEDKMLLHGVAKYGEKNWYKIRKEVPGRSDLQCRERYFKVLHSDVKKGKWSAEEKKKLMELTEKYGVGHWTKVATELTHRTGSQCLSKYKAMIGYFKRKREKGKTAKKDIMSDSESCSSISSSSEDMEMELMDNSEDEMKVLKDREQTGYLIPSLDMWVPRRHFSVEQRKTLMEPLASSRKAKRSKNKRKKSTKKICFPLNTILKGIVYPHSTDRVVEDTQEFLAEAADLGQHVLQIGEDDVYKILRRNTKRRQEKQIQRLSEKQARSTEGTGTCQNQPTDSCNSRRLQQQHRRMDLYKDSVDRKLLIAVTPWVGKVLLPMSSDYGRLRRKWTEADVMRKKLCSVKVTSTPIFTFFIQLFQIDANGCIQMIRERKLKQSIRNQTNKETASENSQVAMKSAGKSNDAAHSLLALPLRPPLNQAGSGGLQPLLPVQDTSTPKPLVAAVSSSSAPQQTNPGTQAIAVSPMSPNTVTRARTPVPIPPKPKTVFELLREKRLQESRDQRAAKKALPQKVLVPQPVVMSPRPATNNQQTVVLPLSPSPAVKSIWPVMPFSPLPACQIMTPNNLVTNPMSSDHQKTLTGSVRFSGTLGSPNNLVSTGFPCPAPGMSSSQGLPQQQTSITLMPTVLSPANNSNTTVPFTWIVTPHGIVPLSVQSLGFPSQVQHVLPHSSDGASSSGSVSGTDGQALTVQLSSKSKVPENQNRDSPIVSRESSGSYSSRNTSAFLHKPPVVSKKTPSTDKPVDQRSDVPLASDTHSPQLSAPLPSTHGSSSFASSYQTLTNLNRSPQDPSESTVQPALTPKKYPVVRIAKILPISQPAVGDVSKTVTPAPSPAPSYVPQSPVSNTDKNILDWSLVSLEEEGRVKDWFEGKQGVHVQTLNNGMAYLPPSICTLKTLSRLLLQKSALEENSFRLVPPTEGENVLSSTEKMEIISDMVDKRLKDNPAYLMLKQRFLSAFTFTGLLAVAPPGRYKTTVSNIRLKRYNSDEDSDSVIDKGEEEARREENVMETQSELNTTGASVPDALGQGDFQETANSHSASVDNTSETSNCLRRTRRKRSYTRPRT